LFYGGDRRKKSIFEGRHGLKFWSKENWIRYSKIVEVKKSWIDN